MKESRTWKNTIRNLIVYVMVVLFFVGIIAVYYVMLYRETKDNMLAYGKIYALSAVDRIDKYLCVGEDDLLLVSYTLDNMLKAGASNEEILAYLVEQQKAIENILIDNTTGLYLYTGDELLDSAGWVPEEGFVCTERPWYKKAVADPQNVVVVDPYLDANTHTVMISLAKCLHDKKSVVAMDLSMHELQAIVENIARKGGCDMEIILDPTTQVVAHSVRDERGKIYAEEEGTMGRFLVDGMNQSSDDSFQLNYDGKVYVVYAMSLENGWTCLTLTDSTRIYKRLTRPLILTVITAVFIIGTIVILLIRSSRQAVLAEELGLKTEKAIAASEAKSAFLSNMSHEIRTPINAVLGMNEMILRECRDDNILPYSDSIKTAGNTLLGIVNDILDFSKIEAGKLEIIPVDYDLSSVINDLVNMVQTRADEKGIELVLDFDPAMPKLLTGDEVRIKQIITNILTNAVKYTEKGNIVFKISHGRLGTDPSSIMLNVSVKDTGIGIKDEDMQRLFSEFERIDEERNRNIEGTGLGMSITKRLLNMMGSSLKVKSVYGEGSEFYFSIKQRVVKWEPLGDYVSTYHELAKKRNKYREKFTAPEANVLVVDDNPMNLTVFKSLLKKTQVNIVTADSGDECLRLAGIDKYDIIFLDHMMPGKDGIETLKEMKAVTDGPNINTPVICLTANAISGAREQYMAEGFDDYLTKPIDSEKLEDMMMTFISDEKIVMEAAEDKGAKDKGAEDKEDNAALSAIRDLKEININEGLKNTGSCDDYINALEVFYESIAPMSGELNDFYERGDREGYTIKVHALKSSARIIGASSLADRAQKLEDAGKAGDSEYISKNHTQFMDDYVVFKDLLKGLFEKNEADKKQLADPAVISLAYEEIKAAAHDMDYDRIEEVLEEMKDYSMPENEAGLWEDIKAAALQFDYEKIIKLLKA